MAWPTGAIPTLHDARVRLEPLAREHRAGMFALFRAPEVCTFAGPAMDVRGQLIPLPARSYAESDRLLDYWLDRGACGSGCRWAVMDPESEAFMGAVGFNALGEHAEYAYHLRPEFWGRGLASEASRLVLDWCFGNGTRLVEAYVESPNHRSIALLRRLGFERVCEAEIEGWSVDADRFARAAFSSSPR